MGEELLDDLEPVLGKGLIGLLSVLITQIRGVLDYGL